jgi:hypothetical protein
MTRVKHHTARRGAATLAAALIVAAAAGVVLAQDAGEPVPLVGAIPDSPDVLPNDPAPESTPEPEPEPEAEESTLTPIEQSGVRLQGNLPATVQPNPERRLTLSLSETLSANSNIGLDDDGGAVGSTTRFGLNYLSIGPISSFRAGLNLGLNVFTGPGSDENNLDKPTVSGSLGWQRSVSRTTQVSLGFNGSFQPETFFGDSTYLLGDSDGDGIDDTVDVSAGDEKDAMRLSLAANAELSHTVNSLNSLSLSFSTSNVQYFDGGDGLTTYIRAGLNGGWNSQLSPTVSGGISTGVSAYFADSADDRTTYTWTVTGNGDWTVNRRMSVNASLGPNLSFSSSTIPSTGESDDYTTLSTRAQFGISYALTDTTWSAALSQNVQPTTEGSIANITAFNMQMRHQINDMSSVTLGSAISYYLPLSEQDEEDIDEPLNVTLRAAYNHALTRDVNATLGYVFRWKDEEDQSPVSHKVFLTLTKSFTFLP